LIDNVLTVVVGTGYTGTRVLQQLSEAKVLGLNRSAPVPPLEHLIHVHDLDLDNSLRVDLPQDYSIIYTVPPAGSADRDTRLRRLFDQLPHQPKRFVYMSTTGVYGNHDGALIDEDAATRPWSERSEQRLAAERFLLHECRERGIELLILRVPGIYGPDRLGLESIRSGVPVLLEADSYPGNRIHVADLVNCCVKATSSSVPPGIYNVGDGDFRTSTWFAHEVARQSQVPPRPEISRAKAEQDFSPQRMSFLSDSRRIDTRKMNTVLGVTSIFASAEDGISSSLEERRHSKIPQKGS
jgi:nucleoside-diphosphate-sugar epimerase